MVPWGSSRSVASTLWFVLRGELYSFTPGKSLIVIKEISCMISMPGKLYFVKEPDDGMKIVLFLLKLPKKVVSHE